VKRQSSVFCRNSGRRRCSLPERNTIHLIIPSSPHIETVLVVDDYEPLCDILETLLGRMGYRVLTATTSAEALQIARTFPKIDLLVSNVEMPVMHGDVLARRFAMLHPSTPVLFISSFNHPIYAVQPSRLLTKPFGITELRDAVRRALQMRPALAKAASTPVAQRAQHHLDPLASSAIGASPAQSSSCHR